MNTYDLLLSSQHVDVKHTETSVVGFEFAFKNAIIMGAKKKQDDIIKSFAVTVFFGYEEDIKMRSVELKIRDKKLSISISTGLNSDGPEEHSEAELKSSIVDRLVAEKYDLRFVKRESSLFVYFLSLPQNPNI